WSVRARAVRGLIRCFCAFPRARSISPVMAASPGWIWADQAPASWPSGWSTEAEVSGGQAVRRDTAQRDRVIGIERDQRAAGGGGHVRLHRGEAAGLARGE